MVTRIIFVVLMTFLFITPVKEARCADSSCTSDTVEANSISKAPENTPSPTVSSSEEDVSISEESRARVDHLLTMEYFSSTHDDIRKAFHPEDLKQLYAILEAPKDGRIMLDRVVHAIVVLEPQPQKAFERLLEWWETGVENTGKDNVIKLNSIRFLGCFPPEIGFDFLYGLVDSEEQVNRFLAPYYDRCESSNPDLRNIFLNATVSGITNLDNAQCYTAIETLYGRLKSTPCPSPGEKLSIKTCARILGTRDFYKAYGGKEKASTVLARRPPEGAFILKVPYMKRYKEAYPWLEDIDIEASERAPSLIEPSAEEEAVSVSEESRARVYRILSTEDLSYAHDDIRKAFQPEDLELLYEILEAPEDDKIVIGDLQYIVLAIVVLAPQPQKAFERLLEWWRTGPGNDDHATHMKLNAIRFLGCFPPEISFDFFYGLIASVEEVNRFLAPYYDRCESTNSVLFEVVLDSAGSGIINFDNVQCYAAIETLYGRLKSGSSLSPAERRTLRQCATILAVRDFYKDYGGGRGRANARLAGFSWGEKASLQIPYLEKYKEALYGIVDEEAKKEK